MRREGVHTWRDSYTGVSEPRWGEEGSTYRDTSTQSVRALKVELHKWPETEQVRRAPPGGGQCKEMSHRGAAQWRVREPRRM